jgi:DNA-binding HxlR family transcriptional regulator
MPAAGTTPRRCAIADALDLIGEKWSLLIVRELFWGNHRFADIAKNTGAPRDVLSARLRTLVDAGVIEKRRYSEHPPRDGYHLKRSGFELAPLLMAITDWAEHHMPADERRMHFPHHDHELQPVIEMRCGTCGEPVP